MARLAFSVRIIGNPDKGQKYSTIGFLPCKIYRINILFYLVGVWVGAWLDCSVLWGLRLRAQHDTTTRNSLLHTLGGLFFPTPRSQNYLWVNCLCISCGLIRHLNKKWGPFSFCWNAELLFDKLLCLAAFMFGPFDVLLIYSFTIFSCIYISSNFCFHEFFLTIQQSSYSSIWKYKT